jgi:hypothetical protein
VRLGEGEPGPRWRASRVAAKVAGYLRPWTVDDRREEFGRPAILVLADVSGSMSAVADEVLRLADAVRTLGVAGAEVVAVAHSNGYPAEWAVGRGRIETAPAVDEAAAFRWYADLVRRYQVAAVIAAGDWDAEWLYRALAAMGIELIWLDPWSGRKLGPTCVPFPPRHTVVEWPATLAVRVRYAFGVGSAEDAVDAIERLVRR